jgi:cation-transporting P-type ATPase E
MDALQLPGLTTEEVAERRRTGQANRAPRSRWRDYGNILFRNLITWFNVMVTPAAIALYYLEQYQGAVAVSGMAIVNTLIGLIQELHAKRHLDKLALLVETRVRVIRDGRAQQILSGDVVHGDTVLLSAGETVVADGPVLQASYLEIDEALLTGESDPVRRQPGDKLLSGSYCVAGEGAYRAEGIGRHSFAHATSAEARHYHYAASPLTRVVNLLIQILSLTALALCLLYTAAYVVEGFPKTLEQERTFVDMVAATLTSMVPQGLVLTVALSCSLGAVHMSQRGAIVQRLAAVETMASIDVICTDKTGTLTTNQLRLAEVRNLADDLTIDEVKRRLQSFASASMDLQNKTIQALRLALGETSITAADQLPFKSQNRYSAVRIRDGDEDQVLALGACEALKDFIHSSSAPWESTWQELLPTGLRILLFAQAKNMAGAPDRFEGTLAGLQLEPLALIGLSDQLRVEAPQVLEALAAQGIAFKVISGDNPDTVRATVAGLNLPLAHTPVVSGDQLAAAPNRAELIRTSSIFGRVSPQQKVEIVRTLQQSGYRVAMIGDGVNDVLPIKKADLGIAMGEGSSASKTVSGLVLENNNFALLPETLEEGRTIIRNLRRSSKLFLVKNVYSLLLILVCFTGLLGLRFPYLPQQVTLLNWLVIGIPAFVIACSRERSTSAQRPRFLLEVASFAVRTGLVFGLAGLGMLLAARLCWPDITGKEQRTLLLSTLILLGLTALFRALTDGEEKPLVGDRRFRLLGALAIPVYLMAMYWPFTASFFDLTPLNPAAWTLVIAAVGLGWILSLAVDRLCRRPS